MQEQNTLGQRLVLALALCVWGAGCGDSQEPAAGQPPAVLDGGGAVIAAADAAPTAQGSADGSVSTAASGTRLSVAGIGVSDLAKSTKFYTEALGMKLVRESQFDDREEKELEFAGIGKGSNVALIHYKAERNYKDLPCKLVFITPDVAALMATLMNAGAKLSMAPVPFAGATVGMVTDPDGYVLEILSKDSPMVTYLVAAGIGNSSLQAATDFYKSAFAMTVQDTYALGTLNENIMVHPSGKGSAVVLMNWSTRTDYRDLPVKHTRRVPDVAAALAAVQAAGGTIVSQPAAVAQHGGAIVGVAKDLDGYVLELIKE